MLLIIDWIRGESAVLEVIIGFIGVLLTVIAILVSLVAAGFVDKGRIPKISKWFGYAVVVFVLVLLTFQLQNVQNDNKKLEATQANALALNQTATHEAAISQTEIASRPMSSPTSIPLPTINIPATETSIAIARIEMTLATAERQLELNREQQQATQRALQATEAELLNAIATSEALTATAMSITDTPTPSLTATPTHIPTLLPTPTPTPRGGATGEIVLQQVTMGVTQIILYDFATEQIEVLTEWPDVLNVSRPNWSPDGTRIVFVSEGNIYEMNYEGQNLEPLTFDNFDDDSPEWSPDGGRIVFVSNRGGSYELWIYDKLNPTNRLQQLTSLNAVSMNRPQWVGDRIIFEADLGDGNRRQIYSLDVPGESGQVVDEVDRLTNDGNSYTGPAISPDGERLIINSVRISDILDPDDRKFNLYEMDIEGNEAPELFFNTEGCFPDAGVSSFRASWSPDGREIMFSVESSEMARRLYIIPVDAANPAARCQRKEQVPIDASDNTSLGQAEYRPQPPG